MKEEGKTKQSKSTISKNSEPSKKRTTSQNSEKGMQAKSSKGTSHGNCK